MKSTDSHLKNYAPLLGILLFMVFVFLYSTLPSIEMNHHLNRVKAKRLDEIEMLKDGEKRLHHLKDALENDPITVEKHLRSRFGSTKGLGEMTIDTKPP